jgi:hypothetical protein
MTREEFAQLEMLDKVAGFARTYDNRIPEDSLARSTFESIDAARATIASLGALPGRTGFRPGKIAREAARGMLAADLDAIHQTMVAVAIDHPGIEANFRLPNRRHQDQRLIKAAQEFHKYAAPLKDAFVAHQLPADFLEKLASDIEALQQAISAQAQAISERTSASDSLAKALEDASVALQRLDPIIRNAFRDDNEVLTAWKTAREVKKRRERRKTAKAQVTNGNSETSAPAPVESSAVSQPPAVPERPAVSPPA